jgi:P27 family predicted phage terminase small subunit
MARPRIPTVMLARPRRVPSHEPRPDVEIPPRPRQLTGAVAKKEWNRVTRELLNLGVISRLDAGVLAAYCTAYATMLAADEAVQRGGILVDGPAGPQKNPAVSTALAACDAVRRLAGELGMSPASRSKVSVAFNSPGQTDELGEHLQAMRLAKSA